MTRFQLTCAAFLFLIASCVIQAQSNAGVQGNASKHTGNEQAPTSKTKPARDPQAEQIRNERRANAQSLLVALAADAAKFTDSTVRARTLARVADQLWEVDQDRARVMFRAAWDAAEVADKEIAERSQEALRQRHSAPSNGFSSAPSMPRLRQAVLQLATRHDRGLGEEFLGKLKEQRERETAGTKNTRPSPMGNIDEVSRQRLEVANQLLNAEQTERAMQFADPALSMISMQTVDFLSSLRDKNAAAADERYAAMLANAAANPESDANTVSVLSSYLFTPHSFFAFVSGGTYTNSYQAHNLTPPPVTPALRLAFFSAAGSILLRPLAPPGQEQNSAGHDGHYLVIKRLMPVFEKYAPPELTTALRGQLEALSALISKSTRDRDDDDMVRTGIRPDKMMENWEQSLLDQLDHAKTSGDRDRINLQLGQLYAGKGDLRARDFVDKIDDSESRTNARAYVDTRLASYAVNKKDVDRIIELIRTGQFAHLQKVRLLTQAATLLAKSDNEKALMLIDLAATEARRIGGSDADSPRAFFAVANAMLVVNRTAVWDAMGEAVKASNSAENFGGEDGQLAFSMTMKGMSWSSTETAPDFDLDGIFAKLADYDYDRTVESAQGFTKDAPRAIATIAIARTVLSQTRK